MTLVMIMMMMMIMGVWFLRGTHVHCIANRPHFVSTTAPKAGSRQIDEQPAIVIAPLNTKKNHFIALLSCSNACDPILMNVLTDNACTLNGEDDDGDDAGVAFHGQLQLVLREVQSRVRRGVL